MEVELGAKYFRRKAETLGSRLEVIGGWRDSLPKDDSVPSISWTESNWTQTSEHAIVPFGVKLPLQVVVKDLLELVRDMSRALLGIPDITLENHVLISQGRKCSVGVV